MTCILCKATIAPGTKVIELAGGFFDRDDPEFFITDDEVLVVSYLHYTCLEKALVQTK